MTTEFIGPQGIPQAARALAMSAAGPAETETVYSLCHVASRHSQPASSRCGDLGHRRADDGMAM